MLTHTHTSRDGCTHGVVMGVWGAAWKLGTCTFLQALGPPEMLTPTPQIPSQVVVGETVRQPDCLHPKSHPHALRLHRTDPED